MEISQCLIQLSLNEHYLAFFHRNLSLRRCICVRIEKNLQCNFIFYGAFNLAWFLPTAHILTASNIMLSLRFAYDYIPFYFTSTFIMKSSKTMTMKREKKHSQPSCCAGKKEARRFFGFSSVPNKRSERQKGDHPQVQRYITQSPSYFMLMKWNFHFTCNRKFHNPAMVVTTAATTTSDNFNFSKQKQKSCWTIKTGQRLIWRNVDQNQSHWVKSFRLVYGRVCLSLKRNSFW